MLRYKGQINQTHPIPDASAAAALSSVACSPQFVAFPRLPIGIDGHAKAKT